MATNVGVNVIEVDGKASPEITPAPTSIAAFLGRTERGVPGVPVRVSSYPQFRARFGGHRADSHLAYAVDGFFLNGGRVAYVSRIVGPGSASTSLALRDRQSSPKATLRLAGGYRGRFDPGRWALRLTADVSNDPRGSSTVPGATSGTNVTQVTMVSVEGFASGSVARFQVGTAAVYRKLTEVDRVGKTIKWTPPMAFTSAVNNLAVATAEFRIVLRYRAQGSGEVIEREDWRHLSMEPTSDDYVVDRLNDDIAGSRLALAVDLSVGDHTGEENPEVKSNQAFDTAGLETDPTATEYRGDATARTGLFAFDTVQMQLLALPDSLLLGAGADTTAAAAMDYCANRGDCMYVGSVPDRVRKSGVTTPRSLADYDLGKSESDYLATLVKQFATKLQGRKVFGALYGPWVQVADPIGAGPAPARFIPPDGHVMGVYARTDFERGIWKAPAGDAANVRGVTAVAATFTDEQHTDMVRNLLVNGIRPLAGLGPVIAASRTLSTDTRWWFVNVRLLMNFVKVSLRDGLRFVRQEPHSEALRRTVKFSVVVPFLLGLWRRGAFGSDAPENVFTVVCDASNNPANEVNLGFFKVEVYFFAAKPAETILIVVGQQPSGASAGER